MNKLITSLLLLNIFFAYQTILHGEESKQLGLNIFVESRCYSCHTINSESEALEKAKEEFAKAKGVELKEDDDEEGDDEKKGGDLSDVGNERESKWLSDFVQNPKGYFKDEADCKKIAKKKHRKRFKGTEEELASLVSYLSSLKYGKQEEDSEACLKE